MAAETTDTYVDSTTGPGNNDFFFQTPSDAHPKPSNPVNNSTRQFNVNQSVQTPSKPPNQK